MKWSLRLMLAALCGMLALWGAACTPNLPALGSPAAPAGETALPGATESVFLPEIARGEAPTAPGVNTAGETTSATAEVFLPNLSGGGTPPAASPASPHVELHASQTALQVSQVFTLTARSIGIGLPYYYLMAQDAGMDQPLELGRVTFESAFTPNPEAASLLEVTGAEGGLDQAVFTLRARAAGTTRIWVNATGEVQVAEGVFTWSGGGSEPLEITVTE